MTKLSQAAAALGSKGGSSRSDAKKTAARENGKQGGRPRTYLYAVQVYNGDTDEWEYKFPAPFAHEEALKNIKQLRRWAKDDESGKRYRMIKVYLQ